MFNLKSVKERTGEKLFLKIKGLLVTEIPAERRHLCSLPCSKDLGANFLELTSRQKGRNEVSIGQKYSNPSFRKSYPYIYP